MSLDTLRTYTVELVERASPSAPPTEDLQRAPDLGLTADHRIELACARSTVGT